LDHRILNDAGLDSLARGWGRCRGRRASALRRRNHVRDESDKRSRSGRFLRGDDPECRETQGHQRRNDNDDDAHRTLRYKTTHPVG
jgi:hypothetical protein